MDRAHLFALRRPCAACPFRPDGPFTGVAGLGRVRAGQIVADCIRGDAPFHCHETVDYDAQDGAAQVVDASVCAGFLLTLDAAHGGSGAGLRANLYTRLGLITGALDEAALDGSAPHYASVAAFVEGHARS